MCSLNSFIIEEKTYNQLPMILPQDIIGKKKINSQKTKEENIDLEGNFKKVSIKKIAKVKMCLWEEQ